jgi:asparagine synthase (glutamine-hydrolysing)
MCGIVGIASASASGQIDPALVRRMADAIFHRGPDDEGIHAGEGVVLGMRRLSIIDLSGGHQPIANETGTVHVVCNGEIYNFRALRQDLERRGHRFRTGSDVEVIVHLYEEYGDRLVEHLSGMYGFALWDSERRRLLVGRDRLGQKPVYYCSYRGGIAFGSEMKSLLTLPGMQARVSSNALREYLAMGYAVAPQTICEGIHRLPPASLLVWENSAAKVTSYWQLPDTVDERLSESDWVERIRTGLKQAVVDHMVSDVPIGAFLSGGIDSSAIVALMAGQSMGPVNTYSIGYVGGSTANYYNELSYAKQVAQRFGTNHHEIPVEPDVAALLPKLLWHVEEPISDSAIMTTWLVSELAAKTVKVILSGVGGDELFAGYNRYLGAHYGRMYRRIPRWLRAGALVPLSGLLPSSRQSRLLDMARYARKFIQSNEMPWREQYRQYMQICALDVLGDGQAVRAPGWEQIAAAETSKDELLRLMRIDAQTQLPEDLLLLTDKVSMAASIECRVPFLDHGFVEMAARIPERRKLRHGNLKHLLKLALEGIVPHEVLHRRKRGFGAPMGAWFKRELRALRDVILNQQVVASRGLLSWPAVERILADHDASREDYSDVLIVLMNVEIWCRLFIDGRSASDISTELTERMRAR